MEFEKQIDNTQLQIHYQNLKLRENINLLFGFLNFLMLCIIAGIVFKELQYAHDTLDEVNSLMNDDVTMMDRVKIIQDQMDIVMILLMRLCKLPGMLHCMPTREEAIFHNFSYWNQTWS